MRDVGKLHGVVDVGDHRRARDVHQMNRPRGRGSAVAVGVCLVGDAGILQPPAPGRRPRGREAGVEIDPCLKVTAAIGQAGVDDPIPQGNANPVAGHAAKQEYLGPPPEDLGFRLGVVQIEESPQNGHREHPPAAPFRQRPGHHAGNQGRPASGRAAGVGGEEHDHAADDRRGCLQPNPSHLTTFRDGDGRTSAARRVEILNGCQENGQGSTQTRPKEAPNASPHPSSQGLIVVPPLVVDRCPSTVSPARPAHVSTPGASARQGGSCTGCRAPGMG